MNILFVVPYTPTLIRTRPYNLLRGLVRRGHSVTLATLWETQAERDTLSSLAGDGIRVWAKSLSRRQVAQNLLSALIAGIPLQGRYCWQPALARHLTTALDRQPGAFDVVHVEHLRGAQYGRAIQRQFEQLRRPIPVVWDSVDCISLLFDQAAQHSRSQFGRWITRLELPRTRTFESALVCQFSAVLTTSHNDKAALEALAAKRRRASPPATSRPPLPVQVLPNGVDLRYFVPPDSPSHAEEIILTGKMSYHANVTAALQLVNDIMPLVWQRRSGVRVTIAGSAPPPAVRELAARHSPQVRVTGFVPDLRPYLQAAQVAVAPIRYGAGIQNKVLEAMACGLPVVTSQQACSALQAIPGQDLLVANTPVEFAEAILRLFETPPLRQSLGLAARRYVVDYHDWDSIVEQLETYYCQAAERVVQAV